MASVDISVARRLIEQIDAAPSPYHAVAATAARLSNAGSTELAPGQQPQGRGRFHQVRGGAIMAWHTSEHHRRGVGTRVVGAHTDSPNLRIKAQPDRSTVGWRQLGVEIYGGVLLNSWLDRDLGMSGRVAVRTSDGIQARLLRVDRPILRVPQLAIHLDREVTTTGLLLDKQTHLSPIWGLSATGPKSFATFLADELGVDADSIISWDLMAHDTMASAIVGPDDDFVSAPRIDNLLSCFTGLESFLDTEPTDFIPVLAFYDHEEVGSVSAEGAASPLLERALRSINDSLGGDADSFEQTIANSVVLSADGAHATHPNYCERHEPDHLIGLNEGPVLKLNVNQRYATTALSAAAFIDACERAGVPFQRFVAHSSMPCGSTIGPTTAGRLGIEVVDAGCAQLAMHSIRELAGSHDPGYFVRAISAFVAP